MLGRVNNRIWIGYCLLEAVGATSISRPIPSDMLRGFLMGGLQPGLSVAFSLDSRFLKHACFAILPTEVWFVSLVTLAINGVGFYVLLVCARWLVKFSRPKIAV